MAFDQGGCCETSRPTNGKEPTYVEEGVTHFCVTNMPGAVPQTSSQAICAAILPWVNKLAAGGDWRGNPALVRGINVEGGKLVHPAPEGMQLPESGQASPGRPCLTSSEERRVGQAWVRTCSSRWWPYH